MGWKIVKVKNDYHCVKNGKTYHIAPSKNYAEWFIEDQKEYEKDKTPLPKEVWF